MELFIINVYVLSAVIWLSAASAQFIIGWYHYDQVRKFDRFFGYSQLGGMGLLSVALISLWSVHLTYFTTHPIILELMFVALIIIGVPIIKKLFLQVYIALKTYSED